MKLIIITPEQRELVDAYALQKFDEFMNDLKQKAHLDELSQGDFNQYLSEEEIKACINLQASIVEWVRRCSQPAGKISIGIYRYSMSSYYYFRDSIKLVTEVYNRKLKKEAEKEKEERRHAAYRALIPFSLAFDAQIFLNESEYSEFNKSISKAIDVYLEQGKEYLDDHRPFPYGWYLDLINNRRNEQFRKANRIREEGRREVAAESEAQEYNKRLNSEIARLKRSLCPSKKDHSGYFQEQVNDARYVGYSFNHVLTDEDRQAFDKTLVSIATRELDKLVAKDFRQFTDSECWRTYFLLPSVDYSSNGVPCLDFTFDVFAVVETRVWLKPGQKSFSGYTFQFPWRGEKGHSILVQEPEFLGYHYHILTPSDLSGYVFWQSVPLVLLKGLLNGETKPAGTTISVASDGNITYRIPKFKEDVDIPDNFAGYLRSISSIDEMASIGIMTERVASIAKGELGGFTVEDEASALKAKIKRKDSKKTMLLKLFSEGKRPGDPEVKSLGIKPTTAYRYYQDWKKAHYNSKNPI